MWSFSFVFCHFLSFSVICYLFPSFSVILCWFCRNFCHFLLDKLRSLWLLVMMIWRCLCFNWCISYCIRKGWICISESWQLENSIFTVSRQIANGPFSTKISQPWQICQLSKVVQICIKSSIQPLLGIWDHLRPFWAHLNQFGQKTQIAIWPTRFGAKKKLERWQACNVWPLLVKNRAKRFICNLSSNHSTFSQAT